MAVCINTLNECNLYSDLFSDVVAESDNSAPTRRVIIRNNLSGQILLDKEIVGDRLLLALQNLPTLEHVTLIDMEGDTADSFVLAAIQNDAIHTVEMNDICCYTDVFHTLLKRKRRVQISQSFIIPEGLAAKAEALVERFDSYACKVEELQMI